MESTTAFLMLVTGLLLRLGLPVVFTIVLVILLRHLDTRWQNEGSTIIPLKAVNTRCWETHGCAPEKRAACVAYNNPNTPCWQLFRNKEGLLREKCLGCKVFSKAPVPVSN